MTRRHDEPFDLVVLGSGVGGLTAALVASLRGLRPLVLESSGRIGGTSALSSGTVWIPDNPYQRATGVADAQAARDYLDALVAQRADAALREAFLAAGPRMLDELARRAAINFRPLATSPDYRQDLPGAGQGGRPLEPEPFDGRLLGRDFDRLRWPIPELMLFGGMMVTRAEAARLVRAYRSLDGVLLGSRLVSRYFTDRLRHRRGTRLVLGNALVARLTKALLDRDVEIRTEARTLRLLMQDGRVQGLLVAQGGEREKTTLAAHGIVLAGGGFPASVELRARHLPDPVARYSAACESCVGDTLGLAQGVGGVLGEPGLDNALWFPSSVATRDDGTTAVYPHIALDRSKPGLVAVNAGGHRFVDEAASYHEFTRAMYRSHRSVPTIPAVLVCDRRFVWKYGLGLIRPLTPSIRSFVERGYLFMADSIETLARSVGVDPRGLAQTVARNNVDARSGIDTVFGKGGNAYDRYNGDPQHRPNPCLGPIARPPFCAVKVYPTPLGTSLGLRTDVHARVVDASGIAIPGLYACGNDMHSVFGGEYPGPGAQLGLAMTFAWVAATHAAKMKVAEPEATV